MSAAAVVPSATPPADDATPSAPEDSWHWPIDVSCYDRSPDLTAGETRALACIGEDVRAWPRLGQQPPAWRALDRLVRPLADARAVVVSESQRQHRCADAAVAAILCHCAHEGSAYWAWPIATWVRILGATQRAFRAVHPPGSIARSGIT
jgi:hypothetical protein